MNRYLALRHLCWKEVRQLLPLVWMLLGLGNLCAVVVPASCQQNVCARIPAVRRGAEPIRRGGRRAAGGSGKERRTLDWLRQLPIAAGDLIAVKLATGLVGLIAVWCLNLLLLAIFVFPTGGLRMATAADSWLMDAGWEYLWPLQSVFLLLAGFVTAWLFRSSLVALLALIPLALLPSVVTFGLNYVYRWPAGLGSAADDPRRG